MTKPETLTTAAGGSPLERGVGRLEPERYARPPCLQCGAMTADEATSRCMGRRSEGGCHGTDLWADAE